MQKKILVIKLGTAVITDGAGSIRPGVIKKLAEEVFILSKTYSIMLVSSGAVGSGKAYFKNYAGTLMERKAAAAVGNPILIRLYHKYFIRYGITVAQALCERHHFANRNRFLQLKQTFEEFWKNDILPIVNENDLVSNVELKFSDNDELATLMAVGFNADVLIICTAAGGLRDRDNRIIPLVEKIGQQTFGLVTQDKSSSGLGGMLSKLSSAKLAVSLGIKVIITGLKGKNALTMALEGKAGTQFPAFGSNLKSRQKWLASGSITPGSVILDNGAVKALQSRSSLLTIGIRKVQGGFIAGEVIRLFDENKELLGVAKARMNSKDMVAKAHQKNNVAARADDIVLF